MDILASILAYFGTVAAIFLALAMSYNAVVYAPLHSITAQHALAVVAKPIPAKAAAKRPADAQRDTAEAEARPMTRSLVVTRTRHEAPPAARLKAERLRNAMLRKEYLRHLQQQVRARQFAAAPPAGALGYADEPRAVFGDDPFH